VSGKSFLGHYSGPSDFLFLTHPRVLVRVHGVHSVSLHHTRLLNILDTTQYTPLSMIEPISVPQVICGPLFRTVGLHVSQPRVLICVHGVHSVSMHHTRLLSFLDTYQYTPLSMSDSSSAPQFIFGSILQIVGLLVSQSRVMVRVSGVHSVLHHYSRFLSILDTYQYTPRSMSDSICVPQVMCGSLFRTVGFLVSHPPESAGSCPWRA